MKIPGLQTLTPEIPMPRRERPLIPASPPEVPFRPSGDELKLPHQHESTGMRVLKLVGSSLLGAVGGGITAGAAATYIGSKLVTGDQSGVLGLTVVGGAAGAALGLVNGAVIGRVVESKAKGALLGGTLGAAVGAGIAVVMNRAMPAAIAKDLLMIGLPLAASGALSGFASAAVQKKN